MNARILRVAAVLALTVVAPLAASAQNCNVNPGLDLWTTPANFETKLDFASTPIPVGFFGPGSDPFAGELVLQGQPLGGGFGSADVVVRRTELAPLPGPGSSDVVPAEIVGLRLVSSFPILVTFNGGDTPQLWNASLCLSNVRPALGALTLTVDGCACPGGGTFSGTLPVLPRITFTRVSPGAQATYDFGDRGVAPIPFTIAGAHWRNDAAGLPLTVAAAGLTLDADCNPATPAVGPLPASANFFGAVRPVRCDSASCVASSARTRVIHWSAAGRGHHDVHHAQFATFGDFDGDGVANEADNCQLVENFHQEDLDGDAVGDGCDNCVERVNMCQEDTDGDGIGNRCETASVEAPVAGGVRLGPVSPNPARGTVAFAVELPRAARVRVAVHDLRGARVLVIHEGALDAGRHAWTWDAAAHGLAPGSYHLRVEAGGATAARRFSFIR